MLQCVFRGTDVLTKAFADDELSFTQVFLDVSLWKKTLQLVLLLLLPALTAYGDVFVLCVLMLMINNKKKRNNLLFVLRLLTYASGLTCDSLRRLQRCCSERPLVNFQLQTLFYF